MQRNFKWHWQRWLWKCYRHALTLSLSLFCLYLFDEFTLNFMSISMWSFYINNGIISHTWTMKYQMSWQNSIRFTKEFSTSVTMKEKKNYQQICMLLVPCANCWFVFIPIETHRLGEYIWFVIGDLIVYVYGKRTLFKNCHYSSLYIFYALNWKSVWMLGIYWVI